MAIKANRDLLEKIKTEIYTSLEDDCISDSDDLGCWAGHVLGLLSLDKDSVIHQIPDANREWFDEQISNYIDHLVDEVSEEFEDEDED